MITQNDKAALRELAKKQQELANLPQMEERQRRWLDHNELTGNDVMIHFETWTFLQDLMPELKTTGDFAREIERSLYINILNEQHIKDDKVVPKTYDLGWQTRMLPFGLDVSRQKTEGVGFQFIHPIGDLQQDFHLLKPSRIESDKDATLAKKDMLEDIFGDILPVRIACGSLGACLSFDIVSIMGMEDMFMNFMDYPDLFKQMMQMLTDDYIRYFRYLEDSQLLVPNNGNDGLAQGSFGFSRELPAFAPDKIKTKHMWGYADSQETKGISPETYEEFFFPYYAQIANEYGLTSYACCEPVDEIWENCVSKLNNLRKVSISPWCDEEYMGTALKGTKTIYHRKPSPNYVGVGADFDESGFREHMLRTIKAARGCKLEISYRDAYTTTGDMNKPRRAVEITRGLVEEYWC